MRKIIVDRDFLENYVDTSNIHDATIEEIAHWLDGEELTEENIYHAIENN